MTGKTQCNNCEDIYLANLLNKMIALKMELNDCRQDLWLALRTHIILVV